MYSGHGKGRTWERTHTALLCVWVFINPVLDANWGTHFANPVESSLNVSLLLEGNLENSQLCSGPAYNSTYLTCIHCNLSNFNKSTYVYIQLGWSFVVSPRRSCKEEASVRLHRTSSLSVIHPLVTRDMTRNILNMLHIWNIYIIL
jgi:hypothetical protein